MWTAKARAVVSAACVAAVVVAVVVLLASVGEARAEAGVGLVAAQRGKQGKGTARPTTAAPSAKPTRKPNRHTPTVKTAAPSARPTKKTSGGGGGKGKGGKGGRKTESPTMAPTPAPVEDEYEYEYEYEDGGLHLGEAGDACDDYHPCISRLVCSSTTKQCVEQDKCEELCAERVPARCAGPLKTLAGCACVVEGKAKKAKCHAAP